MLPDVNVVLVISSSQPLSNPTSLGVVEKRLIYERQTPRHESTLRSAVQIRQHHV